MRRKRVCIIERLLSTVKSPGVNFLINKIFANFEELKLTWLRWLYFSSFLPYTNVINVLIKWKIFERYLIGISIDKIPRFPIFIKSGENVVKSVLRVVFTNDAVLNHKTDP